MNMKQRWATIAGAVLISGAVLAGAAFAADGSAAKANAHKAPMQEQASTLTPDQQAILKQLKEIRQKHFQHMRDESQVVIDQAIKDGKLTQEQAKRMMHGGMRMMPGKHMGWQRGLTTEQVKAKLDEAVKSGKITQDEADKMLHHFTEHQMKQTH